MLGFILIVGLILLVLGFIGAVWIQVENNKNLREIRKNTRRNG